MTGFALDQRGDLILERGEFRMTDGDALLCQTVENVLGTNHGEWFLNSGEGIDFHRLLKKNVSEEAIREEVTQGLVQVDKSLTLENFSIAREGRELHVSFTAKSADGTEVRSERVWR